MSAAEAVERSLERVDLWEDTVRAWAHLDRDRARVEARERTGGPLAGLVVGVKDVFDTGDQPTAYGSTIFDGFRPRADAAAVALLRHAGATVLGKTVTTEFACFAPGPTANPHRLTHTPGGSSSGSAAAVATGMVDVALGTQTAGSVIRPASFCGVLGFKPSFASVATAGVKPVAASLDTVGWFARDVALLDRVRVALTARAPARRAGEPPHLTVVRTEHWDDADDDARAALEAAARLARHAGARVTDAELPAPFVGLAAEHPVVMTFEAARSLAWEHTRARARISESLLRILDDGVAVDPVEYDRVLARANAARASCSELFGDADALLTLAAGGEAPSGLEATGDPRYARMWTLLGLPTVTLPGLTGATGMPVGVQLVGRPGGDAELLAVAEWLARELPAPEPPRR